ncbi:MAG: hypothetical protein JWN41_220 [Thermoleophilia bacterium]|nr:hypothetical protein [Thermoleophilia bacterium]
MLLAFALGAGGCRKVVSDVLLENVVRGLFFDASGQHVTIDCPEGKTMRKDNDFFCDTSVFGRRGTVLVVQQDDWGRIILRDVPPLDRREVEPLVSAWLRRQHGVAAHVSCPTRVIQEAGRNFRCHYRHRGRKVVRVRQVDGVADYDFSLPGGQRS